MKCLQCNLEFEPKRADAKFCSAKCRKLAFRNKLSVPNATDNTDGTDNLATDNGTDKLSVTKPVSVTKVNEPVKGITLSGSNVYENGKLVPEEELNVFYRGLRGKLELSKDLAYIEVFSVSPVILREIERRSKIEFKSPKLSL